MMGPLRFQILNKDANSMTDGNNAAREAIKILVEEENLSIIAQSYQVLPCPYLVTW